MYGIIYKTTNLINGKIYVGQTTKNRNDYFGSGIAIARAIEKYGKESFVRETLCEANDQFELDEKEIFWIESLSAQDNNIGYNLDNGGIGKGKTSEETCKKISNSKKAANFKHSQKTKEKISRSKKGQGLGQKRPKEWRQNIKNGLIGKPKSTEHRKKIGNVRRGKTMSAEQKKKISESFKERVWIVHPNKTTKFIYKKELIEYLNKGWQIGRKYVQNLIC